MDKYPTNKALETVFKVEIKVNHLPYFKPALQEIIALQMTHDAKSWELKLPTIIDEDGDVVSFSVNFGDARFITLRAG